MTKEEFNNLSLLEKVNSLNKFIKITAGSAYRVDITYEDDICYYSLFEFSVDDLIFKIKIDDLIFNGDRIQVVCDWDEDNDGIVRSFNDRFCLYRKEIFC